MYAVTKFAAGSDEIVNKAWGNLPAPFDWDPNPNENVQYGNGGNNAPASGIAGTIALNTPYVLATSLSFPPENGLATNNFNFWLNGANNGNGAIQTLDRQPRDQLGRRVPALGWSTVGFGEPANEGPDCGNHAL